MANPSAMTRLTDQPVLDAMAAPLSAAVRGAYHSAGAAGQQVKNAAHGVWLGHPLHPVFTDLPLGAWTTGLVLDALAARNGDRGMQRAADVAIAVGLAGAAGAAVTGLSDWSETSGRARRTGLIHGVLNIAATTLFAASWALRKNGSRASGQTCALAGYGIAIGSAWLGGDLVYDQRIGVTHAAVEQPETFTPVAASSDLADNAMTRARTGNADALPCGSAVACARSRIRAVTWADRCRKAHSKTGRWSARGTDRIRARRRTRDQRPGAQRSRCSTPASVMAGSR